MNRRVGAESLGPHHCQRARWPLLGALLVWALGASAEVSAGECQLLLSEAQMNYGRLLRSQMKRVNGPTGALYEVGKRTLNVTAVCPADTIMSLTFNGMGIDDQRFGFALNGFITFRVLDAQLDGRSVQLLPADQGRAANERYLIYPGKQMVPYDGAQIARGERLAMLIEVDTWIDEASTKVSAATQWKSSGEFEVRPL